MASQADVRRIALALPEVREETGRFAFSVLNKGKLKDFAWVWLERVEPKGPRVPNRDVLAVRVRDQNGFPAVLVRLPAVTRAQLEKLIVDAWTCQAPRQLGKQKEMPRRAPAKARR